MCKYKRLIMMKFFDSIIYSRLVIVGSIFLYPALLVDSNSLLVASTEDGLRVTLV